MYLAGPLTMGGQVVDPTVLRVRREYYRRLGAALEQYLGTSVYVPHVHTTESEEQGLISRYGGVVASRIILHRVAGVLKRPYCTGLTLTGTWTHSRGCVYEYHKAQMERIPIWIPSPTLIQALGGA